MTVTVLYFATLRQATKIREERVELPEGATIKDLLDDVCCRHSSVEPYLGSLLVARNQEYAAREESLIDGDEVALMPPVSGG